jgi:hypothetical protein
MTRATSDAVLGAAAKVLAWELFAAAGHCRTKAFVNVDKFNRELLSAVRQWKAVHANLKGQSGRMETPNGSRPFWRQGDIYFVKLDEEIDPEKATLLKSGVIARGEHTGHSHRLSPSSLAAGAALYLIGRSMFLRSPQPGAAIVHNEHHAIDLPAGSYAVVPQQEFDGLRWRQVLD